jgi:alpha-L-rhamnosidase
MAWAETRDAMGRLYGIIEYKEVAKKMRQSILLLSCNDNWYCDNAVRQKDGSLKLSGSCTETCQYYAFYFKTATPKTHPELWKTLVEDFGPSRAKTKKHPEIYPSNAFIGNYLRLECLAREGLSAKIHEETRGFFLYMAAQTGTLWENINTSASCNHGFASHIAVSYARDLIGLKNIDYIAKTVEFAPPTDVPAESLHLKIPLDDGSFIEAGWKKENGKVVEEISLPTSWRRK